MSEELITKQYDELRLSKFDVQRGELEAVVTSFNNYDIVNDRIMPGAVDTNIKGLDGRLVMLYQHESKEIIGEWTELEVRGDLVVAKGEIYSKVSRGADSMELISRGMIGATSIGFIGKRYEENDKGGYDFSDIELREISLVRTPANPKAQIISAKDDDGAINIRTVEAALRDVGLSQKERKLLLAGGVIELMNQRDVIDIDTQKQEIVSKLSTLLK